MILKITGIILISILIVIVLKDTNENISLLVSIVSVILVLIIIFNDYAGVINDLIIIAQTYGIKNYYVSLILKVAGVCYLCEFTSAIAKDAGVKTIAGCIEFSSKVFVAIISMPLFKELIVMITGLIP